jgi:hypothetical protein
MKKCNLLSAQIRWIFAILPSGGRGTLARRDEDVKSFGRFRFEDQVYGDLEGKMSPEMKVTKH